MSTPQYFLPAEWHCQSFVQLAWPDETTDWRPYLADITQTMTTLVEAITRYEDVVIAARDVSAVERLLDESLPAGRTRRITFAECPVNDTWARDCGGVTLLSRDDPEPLVLDFRFNGWGEKFISDKDNEVTRRLHALGIVQGKLIDNNDFVLEGGSIESDGFGTIFTTSHCLLAPRRNIGLTQEEIETQLKRRLHAKRIIWLNHGRLIGDDTDGHIDTIVRVCPANTLLYVKCTDPADPQYADFKALEDELQTLRTGDDGKPYNLVALPMPRPVVFDGERLPATYANFLPINNAVIVPAYGQEDLDEEACRIIAGAFPLRDIIPVDATTIIRQHGSIHCLTMQYPVPDNEAKDDCL